MEDKSTYTPQEVRKIAEAYYRVKSASLNVNPIVKDGNKDIRLYHFMNTHLPEFERDVPENVRTEMTDISGLVELIDRTKNTP